MKKRKMEINKLTLLFKSTIFETNFLIFMSTISETQKSDKENNRNS